MEKIARQIAKLVVDVFLAAQAVIDVQEQIERLESKHRQAILLLKGPDNKPLFFNEDLRKIELTERLRKEKEYTKLKKEKEELELKSVQLKAELELQRNLLQISMLEVGSKK